LVDQTGAEPLEVKTYPLVPLVGAGIVIPLSSTKYN
jgi:hypothetical protein